MKLNANFAGISIKLHLQHYLFKIFFGINFLINFFLYICTLPLPQHFSLLIFFLLTWFGFFRCLRFQDCKNHKSQLPKKTFCCEVNTKWGASISKLAKEAYGGKHFLASLHRIIHVFKKFIFKFFEKTAQQKEWKCQNKNLSLLSFFDRSFVLPVYKSWNVLFFCSIYFVFF